MNSIRIRLAALTVTLLAAAAPLLAVGQGRMFGVVVDENGQPVPGAKITVTTEQMPSFKVSVTAGKNGKYTIALVDATKTYLYRVEKEGFNPLEETVKIDIGSNTEHDFTLLSPEAARREQAAAGGEEGGGGGADPAVLAYNEGVAAVKANDDATAVVKFQQAIELDPELQQPVAALAQTYLKQKKYKEAAELAEKAVALDPGDERALRIRLEAWKGVGDKAKIAEAQAAVGAVDPSAAAVEHYNQGIELYNAGKTGEALAKFQAAQQADASNARTYYMLGLCYTSAGKSAEAKENFEKFIAMAPSDPDVPTAKEMLSYL